MKFNSLNKLTALAVFVAFIGFQMPAHGIPFCPFKAFEALTVRIAALQTSLEAKILSFIQTKSPKILANVKRASWQGIADEDRRLMQAAADHRKAIASANEVSGNLLEQRTAEQLADTLALDRAIASGVEYEDIGQGIGHIVKHPYWQGKDSELANAMKSAEAAFANDATLKKYFYSEAEWYRDWKELLESSPPSVGPNMWTSKMPNAEAGSLVEVAAAAHLKRNQHTVLSIGPDESPNFLLPEGSKVDVMTSTELYQIGIRGSTIKDKLVGLEGEMAVAIKKALDSPNGAGKRFKFASFDNNWTPQAGTIENLNHELAELYKPLPSPQIFQASDFVTFPLQ